MNDASALDLFKWLLDELKEEAKAVIKETEEVIQNEWLTRLP